jgi:hypothetical protein
MHVHLLVLPIRSQQNNLQQASKPPRGDGIHETTSKNKNSLK